jgi:hypothetical protein
VNAAGDTPDEGLTSGQIPAAATGPIPRLPRRGGPPPGAPTEQPVQRPAGDARPAPSGLAGEDDRFEESGPSPAGSREENEPSPADAAAASGGEGNGLTADREPHARLLEGDELQRVVLRWKEIQAHFVDEPRTAVEQADALVAGLMQQLAAMLARERAELEQRWAGGDGVSTEELRQSLRRYRSFFERLLAA